MDQMENNGGRTPFADLTNTPIGGDGDRDESNLVAPIADAKERKREGYASMSVETRNEINKKRPEACWQNNERSLLPESSRDMDTDSQVPHMNQTAEPFNIE
ncbi:hypothetical protein BS78_01G239500, partial [Paspalum vaginatum]